LPGLTKGVEVTKYHSFKTIEVGKWAELRDVIDETLLKNKVLINTTKIKTIVNQINPNLQKFFLIWGI
jgi:hypothetical protein